MINLFEYQNKESFPKKHFDNLEVFLDEIWTKREKTSYYTEDENREEVQRFVQFLHKNNELKSNKFVGVIHFENETLNLLPKIFYKEKEADENDIAIINTHILWWLSYCRKLKFPNYLSGLKGQKSDFFEILIYLFSKYTKELLSSSIYQKYIEIENELSFVKGRVNFNTYINQNLAKGRNHKVNCTYDSFEMNNAFNQCIKSVTRLLLSATRDIHNKRNLSDILFLLNEVSDVAISAEECRRFIFNPIFSSFETVRDYCILFLENCISFNYKNALKLFAFLLPMEYVFEDFLFGFIEKEIENVKASKEQKHLDESKSFELKPDYILQTKGKRFIADAKYKITYKKQDDKKGGISQSDLYQMVGYAIRFNVNDVKLFYPKTILCKEITEQRSLEIIDALADSKHINISTHKLNIIDPNLTIEKLKEENSIKDIFSDLKLELQSQLNTILNE